MGVVIVNQGFAGPLPLSKAPVGQYLVSFDPDAYDGRGHAQWSANRNKAMVFESGGQALEFWRTQSKVKPFRPDGHPNRPLTAYHVTLEQV